MSLLAQLYNKPSWVRYGAAIDLDFINQRYYGGYMGLDSQNSANTRMKSLISPGGNSTANSLYVPNSTGLLTATANNAPCLSDLGLWVQNTSNTNQCGFSRNLLGSDASGSWVTTGSPTISTTSISSATGSASGASRITAGAANDTVRFSKVGSVSSASFTSGCYMRRRTGTGEIDMTQDGGSTWVRVDTTSGFNSTTYTKVEIPAQTLADPSVGFRIVTSGDAIDVDFVMCANNIDGVTQLATPIVTPTGASVSRGGCAAFLNNPSTAMGFNDGARICNTFLWSQPISGIAEVSGNGAANCLIFGMDQGILVSGGCDGGVVTLSSATSTHGISLSSTNTGIFGLGNINKIGWSYGGGRSIVAVNGITTIGNSTHFPNTATKNTHGGWGSHNNTATNANNINGPFRRVTLFPRDITEGELINYTS